MTSLYTLISFSKQLESKKKRNIKMLHKPITKQKIQLIQPNCLILVKQEDQLYKITNLERITQSDQKNEYKCQTLGALLIDKLLKNGYILERKYDNEFFECRLSLFNQNTRMQGEYDQLMHFYDRLPCEMITEYNRNLFQDSIQKPYECLNLQFIDGILVGIKKKMNYDFLRLMGINEEILEDYIQKENQIPICWDIQNFIKLRDGIYYNFSIVNFQGEIFDSQIEIKKFLQSNTCLQLSNYFIYFIYTCNRNQLNVNQIEKNYLTYFQYQTLPFSQQILIHKSRIMKPCLVKSIRNNQ